MAATSSRRMTELLIAWSEGDKAALDKLIPFVYEELRRLANRYMRRENRGHTLQTSALVNEAYLKLIDQRNVRWQNRAHFFAVSAQLMRRILVDHARGRARDKRGGGALKVSLDEASAVSGQKAEELIALDDALAALAGFDPRKSKLVELRFFGGLSAEETAEVMGISTRTVEREWRLARAWLRRELNRGGDDEA